LTIGERCHHILPEFEFCGRSAHHRRSSLCIEQYPHPK
jgi:hypothetical protein